MSIDVITLTVSKNYTDKQIEKASIKGVDLSGYVQSVNGVAPDEKGNVELSGGNVDLTGVVKSVNGVTPDENGNVEIAVSGTAVTTVEPADDDIPKVYFTGTLPTSKDDGDLQLTMHYISKSADFIYPVTLKVQGSSSAGYPKKNFTLKPYKDNTYEKKQKLIFKNWPEMNKFVLKAHWVDHSHVRNVGTAKLWGKVVASRADYNSLPEELRNAPNNGATDGFTVKVFCNGVYQGLYEWIVAKDKLFGQDSDIGTHSILNSEWNNQSTCAFATTSPTMSGNWSEELQDSLSSNISTSFANLIKFVAGSTDEEFVANAENYFDVQSVIDYDIFARIFCIVDNLCRNQIFFTYDGKKWYEGVWDVDAVLGLHPTAGDWFAYDTAFQEGYVAYKDFGITNKLYQRVEALFGDRLVARYEELRSGVLSVDSIIDVYERLTDVLTTFNGLLDEDYAKTTASGAFTGIPHADTNNIQQIRNFIAKRLVYMDSVIVGITESFSVTNHLTNATSNNTATVIAGGSMYTAKITPGVGYTLEGATVSIKMGGEDITASAYNNGVISIASVSGNVVITISCPESTSITYLYKDGVINEELTGGITGDDKVTFGDTSIVVAQKYSEGIKITNTIHMKKIFVEWTNGPEAATNYSVQLRATTTSNPGGFAGNFFPEANTTTIIEWSPAGGESDYSNITIRSGYRTYEITAIWIE